MGEEVLEEVLEVKERCRLLQAVGELVGDANFIHLAQGGAQLGPLFTNSTSSFRTNFSPSEDSFAVWFGDLQRPPEPAQKVTAWWPPPVEIEEEDLKNAFYMGFFFAMGK